MSPPRLPIAALLLALVTVTPTIAQDKKPAPASPPTKPGDAPIDWDKARGFHERFMRGEKLNPDELAYYNRARASKGQPAAGSQPQGAPKQSNTPVSPARSYTPLTELGSGKHEGQDGGLYGGGSNEPPKSHADAARRESARIRPLNGDGEPADDGKIVLLSLGMSNTTQEFSMFKRLADADPLKSPRLVIVDGAQGGQDAAKTSDPAHQFWSVVEQRLGAAGVSAKQVQVVWIKQAVIAPQRDFAFETPRLQGYLEKIVGTAKQRYPNLRVAYLSSRTYGGYATTRLNPEPYAYESAFAVRGLIQEQMKGNAALSFDPARGGVKSPVLLWGPYLWSDGKSPHKADGFFYVREDFTGDGTHPSDTGRRKVADLLLNFMKSDANAKTWFVKP